MQMTKRRPISILLAMMMALGVFAVMPMTAKAANHDVVIAQSDTVAAIQSNIQNAIDGAANGDTVTVTGGKTGVGDELALTIPAGKTVIWKAVYSGNPNVPLISLNDVGTFEVAAGGELDNANPSQTIDSEDATVIVSGGTVKMSAAMMGTAIYAHDGNVMVTGGTVEAVGGYAIDTHEGDGSVTISGGTVKSGGSIVIESGSGNVTVSGGTVLATNYASVAISTNSGNVTVSGGAVSASTDAGCIAVSTDSGDITVSGGTVSASGPNCMAIETDSGKIRISGGEVKADGMYAVTIFISGDTGNAAITGGKVSATGTDSFAISLYGGGAAAYLQGTVTGAFDAQGERRLGIVLEVDTLTIPKSRNQTAEGLAEKARGTYVESIELFWDTTGAKPIIEIVNSGWDIRHSIEWGRYPSDLPIATPTTAPKDDIPTPPVPVLYDIVKSGDSFTFKAIIANGKGSQVGKTITVKLNERYSATVTIGADGVGNGTLEAPGFTGSVAVFSARINGMASSVVSTPMLVTSLGKVVKR